MTGGRLTIRVGDRTYALESPAPDHLAYFTRAYAACLGHPADVSGRFALVHEGAQWQVLSDDAIFAEGPFEQVIHLLDWELARRAVKEDSACAAFHAAWVVRDRQAAMLAGEGSSGKSRLCLQLLDHGFRCGAEDVTFFRDGRLVPFPRAIQLRDTDRTLDRVPSERLFVGYDGRICVEVPVQDAAAETDGNDLTVAFLDPEASPGPARPLAAFEGLQRLFALCHRLDRVTQPLFDLIAGLASTGRMYVLPRQNTADALLRILPEPER